MPDGLGARLREARQRRGLSLRSLANTLGISASMVSQVEGGKAQPSVATLYAMASHLGVSLDELLGNAPESGTGAPFAIGAVQRGRDNPVIEIENGVRWERLACMRDGPAEPILVTYEPGASSSIEDKLIRHTGVEYAYILEGELHLQLEFDVVTLTAGDSLCFDSQRPHLYSNKGEVSARGLWFVAERLQSDAQSLGSGEHALRRRKPTLAVDVLRSADQLD